MIIRLRESLRVGHPLCKSDVPTWLVCIGLVIVQTGFGVYPVLLEKYSNGSGPKANPLVFSFYRDLFCTPVLFLCAFVAERKLLRPSVGMLFLFAIIGLTMFGSQYLYILGVYHTGATPASAFQPTIAIWTAVLAAITCTEKLPSYRRLTLWAKFLGVFLAAGGAVDIVLTDNKKVSIKNKDSWMRFLGYLFLVGNTFITALFILIQKRYIFNKPDNKWKGYPVLITAYSYIFGAMFMGLTSLQYINKPHEYQLPSQAWLVLLYAVFVTSALCYLILTWANSHVSSIMVTAFWPVQVLVAITVSWFLVGDQFTPLQYVGAGVLILGLFLVLWSEYQDDREKQGKGGLMSKVSLDCGCHGNNDNEQQPLLIEKNASISPERTITEDDVKKYLADNLPLSRPVN